MKHFKYYLLSAIIGILLGISGCFLYQKHHEKVSIESTIQLDSLKYKIDSLQCELTTLQNHTDTVYIVKEIVKETYEEKAENIINQSADADWKYFTNFLRARFPSDSCTIKTN